MPGPLREIKTETDKKREFIELLCPNRALTQKKLDFTYKKPFDIFAKGHGRSNWLRVLGKLRTYYIYNLAFGSYMKRYVLRGNGIA